MKSQHIQKALPSTVELWFQQAIDQQSKVKRASNETVTDVVARVDVGTLAQLEYVMAHGANPDLVSFDKIRHWMDVFGIKSYQTLLRAGRSPWTVRDLPFYQSFEDTRWTKMSDVGRLLVGANTANALKFNEIWDQGASPVVAVTNTGDGFGAIALALFVRKPLDALSFLSRGMSFEPAPHFTVGQAAQKVLDCWLVSKRPSTSLLVPFQKVWTHLHAQDAAAVDQVLIETREVVTAMRHHGREGVPINQWRNRSWAHHFGGVLSTLDLRANDEAWKEFSGRLDELGSQELSSQSVEEARAARQQSKTLNRQRQEEQQSSALVDEENRVQKMVDMLDQAYHDNNWMKVCIAVERRDHHLAARLIDKLTVDEISQVIVPQNPPQKNSSFSSMFERRATTLLHIACKTQHPETIKLLLDKGANCNALDHEGITPLYVLLSQTHYIMMSKSLLVRARQLIKKMDHVDQKNKLGNTLLLHLLTAVNSSLDRIELLLSSGADPFIKNNKGLDAMGILMSNKQYSQQEDKTQFIKTFIHNLQRLEIEEAVATPPSDMDPPVETPRRKRM